MKRFADKIKGIIKYSFDYEQASLPMKVIAGFVGMTCAIAVLIGVMVMYVTVPVWIIPYAVLWCKKGGAE